MKEPIKKEPEITNTLFRFVGLRSPQLPEETDEQISLVKIPEGVLSQSHFYTELGAAQQGISKKKALANIASNFSTKITEIQNIKDKQLESYNFSQWIINNRNSYTQEALLEEAAKVTNSLTIPESEDYWDALFYQIITQKSFYMKEALMQLLLGDHVHKLINQKASDQHTEDDFKKYDEAMRAKVVLPVELFGDYTKEDKATPDDAPGTLYSITLDKATKQRLTISEASLRLGRYKVLKKALEKSEKKYRAAYSTAYDSAFKKHNDTIKPILDKYSSDVEAERVAYATHREQIDSTLPYDPNNPYDKAKRVAAPDVPEFNFTYDAEVSSTKMKTELSEDTYADLLNVLYRVGDPNLVTQSTDSVDEASLFEGYETYQNIYEALSTAESITQGEITQNTSITPKSVTVGGLTIPVKSSIPRLANFEFKLCGKRTSQLNYNSFFTFYSVFNLLLKVPDSSWSINKIEVKSVNYLGEDQALYVTHPDVVNTANVLELNPLYFSREVRGLDEASTIEFSIHFNNGQIKTISNIDGLLNSCVGGVVVGGSSTSENADTISKPFKPDNFGFTDIGVADYKRVDQTIQCYVAGEVSHIENIMAREYKERSTRKLRRSEETTTTSTETEQEQLTDTTTTDRFEMQSEVDKVVQSSKDRSGFVNAGASGGTKLATFYVNGGLSFANNTSREDSSRQSRTEAQEVTERALDRVVKKVREERIRKVIEEFEENNKHGFDNREGDKHVVGVYRWVDKLYKNQIVNYGKRMMLEFMIPDPSRLHVLGLKKAIDLDSAKNETLVPPPDPRIQQDENSGNLILNHAWSIKDDDQTNVSYWSGYYNVEIEPQPENLITVGESFGIKYNKEGMTGFGYNLDECYGDSGHGKVSIPEGYKAYAVKGLLNTVHYYPHDARSGKFSRSLTIGDTTTRDDEDAPVGHTLHLPETNQEVNPNYTKEIPVSFTLGNYPGGDVSVTIYCRRTQEANHAWKQKTFNAIIDAYEEALADYNEKVKNQATKVAEQRKTNPGFYRDIENKILRKNCISYLLDQDPNAEFTYGKSMDNNNPSFEGYEINPTQELTNYASFVKFMEQAFEWNIMSYNFYPYYWGEREKWDSLYSFDNSDDPVFRDFMQAGMARVILTVRPGFEEAVRLYLSTRMIWNGGEVPVIGDELNISLVDEFKAENLKPEKDGAPWITRVPTSLTILQADSIGLKVDKALPCNCDNKDEFDDALYEIPCGDNFEINEGEIGQSKKSLIQFTFRRMDNLFEYLKYSDEQGNEFVKEADLSYFDTNGYFPKVYECMGEEIVINRDASWNEWDNLSIVYSELADKLSLITGVNAEVVPYYEENDKLYPDAIRFTIDTNILPEFTFIKKDNHGAWDPNFDMLKVITNDSNVRVIHDNHYLSQRIYDRNDSPILEAEQNTLLPIDRFDYE